MKPPRLSIATSMALVCAVAFDITGVRAFYSYRPESPTFEAVLLGVPLIAIALQVGLFRTILGHGRTRAFWVGFLALGLLSVGTFVATFLGFPDSMETPLFVWGAYFELTGAVLYGMLPAWLVSQYWFVWWLGAASLLAVPHLLLASAGGLLARRLGGAASPSPPALELGTSDA